MLEYLVKNFDAFLYLQRVKCRKYKAFVRLDPYFLLVDESPHLLELWLCHLGFHLYWSHVLVSVDVLHHDFLFLGGRLLS